MARFTLVRTFLLGVAFAFTVAQGCAKQGEGERCEPNAARSTDCDDGLECVPGKELLDNVPTADDFGRCCPPQGQAISDDRCARGGLSSGGSGGTNAEGGAPNTGMAGMAGETASGAGAGGDVSTGGMSGSGAGGEPASPAGGAAGAAAAGAPGAGGQSGAPATAGAGGA